MIEKRNLITQVCTRNIPTTYSDADDDDNPPAEQEHSSRAEPVKIHLVGSQLDILSIGYPFHIP